MRARTRRLLPWSSFTLSHAFLARTRRLADQLASMNHDQDPCLTGAFLHRFLRTYEDSQTFLLTLRYVSAGIFPSIPCVAWKECSLPFHPPPECGRKCVGPRRLFWRCWLKMGKGPGNRFDEGKGGRREVRDSRVEPASCRRTLGLFMMQVVPIQCLMHSGWPPSKPTWRLCGSSSRMTWTLETRGRKRQAQGPREGRHPRCTMKEGGIRRRKRTRR